ncbi:MAG: serine/threonine protein kinase [Planctomycetes bacterium]|nr:serine/threonine protein kinase [Planctomycetota bacterium]
MDDRRILEFYPLPLARGYRRYRNASEPRERHDAAYYLFEIYLKYAASIAMANYLAREDRDHRVNAALKGLARPSLGEWARFLRESLRFLSQEKEPDPVIQALEALWDAKESRRENLLRLYNGLRSFREGNSSEREKASLGMMFEEVVGYSNRVLGHGAPLSREHYEQFGGLFGKAFLDLLEASSYLTARRLVTFDSLQIEEGSKIECGVVEFMSDRPMRRDKPLILPYGDKASEKHRLYLLGENGEFLSLEPFLIAYREDVYILNEAEGAPEYLSYATGERYKPSSAGERQRQLFSSIFGYGVDESRVSRLGEDLAPAIELEKAPASQEGERRLGDYRILREIGRGAMGVVFEAIQESLGRRVALKVLPGTFVLEPRRLERFRREARATARIHHPSIVPVYEVGEAEGNHFYAMEFIDGTSLDRVLEDLRARPAALRKPGSSTASDPAYIARAVEKMAELAEGLEEAHRLGLIHRDVKPSNILVDASGRFILVDFGLVHEAEAKTITRSGEMVGTLHYMSPEQVSRGIIDARSDVYSLGVTLYEALTLKAPYQGPSMPPPQGARKGVNTPFKEPFCSKIPSLRGSSTRASTAISRPSS